MVVVTIILFSPDNCNCSYFLAEISPLLKNQATTFAVESIITIKVNARAKELTTRHARIVM